MKRLLSFLAIAVCIVQTALAGTVEVKLNLWTGETDLGNWSGYVTIATSKLSDAAVGDELQVTVSATSEEGYSQIGFNNASWTMLAGTSFVPVTSAPSIVSVDISAETLADIQSGSQIICKGSYCTITSIDLLHKTETGDSEGKGNAVKNVWNGEQSINWNGTNEWLKLAAGKFTSLAEGNKLRLSFKNTTVSTTGRIVSGKWKAFPDLKNVSPLTGSYFEYDVTKSLCDCIQKYGIVVSGVGYTVTSVDIIDPTKQYSVIAQVSNNDIQAWPAGTTPKLDVTLTNAESIDLSVPLTVSVTRDMVDDDTERHSTFQSYQQDVTLASGETKTVTISMPDLITPGFYNLVATANGNDVCSYTIGYAPTEIVSESTAAADFWSYWQGGLDELAAVAPEYTIVKEMTDKSTDQRKVYLVEMKSVPDTRGGTPVTIRGYYAEPTGEGTYPAIVHYLGTDGGSSTPWCMGGDDNPGYCEFILSVRGQMLNNRDPYKADNIYGSDYYSYEWGDTAKHYYRGAYLDCVRAIDLVKSREKVDANNIFAAGGSQGGCFTYVAAGLTNAFRAIAPSITGHADFVDGMKIVNWPRAKFIAARDNKGMTDDEMNAFNAYYDVMNFSEHIACPVITSFSLQDRTDPPHTNIAPFNLLTNVATADKEYIINPFLGHATASDWSSRYLSFFKQHAWKDKTNPRQTVWKGSKNIDWNGTNDWIAIGKDYFTDAEEDMKLRFNFSNLAIGAQGHIVTGTWGEMPDGNDYFQLSATYYEYTITADMLAQLQKGGCIVTGVGFCLTSIDLINTTLIPQLDCAVVKADIKAWEADGAPVLRLTVKNNEEKEVKTSASVSLRSDKYEDVATLPLDLTLAAGEEQTATFTLPTLEPGFYHAVVEANYALVSDFNIGYNPTAISSPVDAQSDFDEFWAAAKSDLAAVAPEYTMTKIEEKSTAKRNVYLVEMKSIDNGDGQPVTIRAYYAEPVAEGTYPVLISQNGYDSDPTQSVYCPSGDGNPDWIELYVSVRGQLLNNREPNTADNIYGDWFVYNLGDKDKYYYRGAYMDAVRSIDFIASRPKAQKENIFMQGGSQGGALTIAGAALDTRLNAIAPSIPFMGDFPDYFQVGSWPAYPAQQYQKANGLTDEDMYACLSYFDTKNLAPRITCPVIMASGLQDNVCPPHTNFAPYNNLTVTDKQYVVNPDCKHETPASWYNTYMDFFRAHLVTPSGITEVNAQATTTDTAIYDLQGRRLASLQCGINIVNGKKIVRK